MDRMKGLEPSLLVWKTRALPLMQHPDSGKLSFYCGARLPELAY